jgi:hypothetical protein
MSGTLKDPGGTPVAGAVVTAYLQAKGTDGKFPPVFNTATQSDGSFLFNGLVPGTYILCADMPKSALLNPCLWSLKRTTSVISAGASATGVLLVAERGVALNIRINDVRGLLASNPMLDDLLIGVRPKTGPPMPVPITSKDRTGKTLTVFVPQAQPVDILIYSANLTLADAKGNPFTGANVKVPVTAPSAGASQSTSQAGTTPDLTINILSQAQKP